MKFFIVELRYIASLEAVQQFTESHRAFLQKLYADQVLLLSGPSVPRTKGILIARYESLEGLKAILKNDPYQQNGLVEPLYTEFAPANFLPEVSSWLLKD